MLICDRCHEISVGLSEKRGQMLCQNCWRKSETAPVAETPLDTLEDHCERWLREYDLYKRNRDIADQMTANDMADFVRAEAARASGAPTREEWLFDVARKLEADSELALDLVITRDKLAAVSPASGAPTPQAVDLCKRITDYLEGGGLFNPEMAIHDAVRDLLIDCRAELAAA